MVRGGMTHVWGVASYPRERRAGHRLEQSGGPRHLHEGRHRSSLSIPVVVARWRGVSRAGQTQHSLLACFVLVTTTHQTFEQARS